MKYLEDFITDCTARGLARTTTATYRSNVKDFLDHIDKDPTEIHMDDLRGDRRGDAIDIYDHIDPEELRRSYLQHVPRFGQVDRCQATLTEMIH